MGHNVSPAFDRVAVGSRVFACGFCVHVFVLCAPLPNGPLLARHSPSHNEYIWRGTNVDGTVEVLRSQ